MNIFLPYEESIKLSVQSLDNVRLQKQAVECWQLLTTAIEERNGDEVKGHSKHPVYNFYKDNTDFLAFYGLQCCIEWEWRNNKPHSLTDHFRFEASTRFESLIEYQQYYMEGSKNTPECIRTTRYVSQLFQAKLVKKWLSDIEKGRTPKWGVRKEPDFWIRYLYKTEEEKNEYWKYIEEIKKEVRDWKY